jgi:hypothetical protein
MLTRRLLILALALTASSAQAVVDDHQIHIKTQSDLAALRTRLIRFVWGQENLPGRLPDNISAASSPMGSMENLDRTESITINMESGLTAIAYHYIPRKRNNRLVVVHQGHSCDTGAAGVGDTIRDLVLNGYGVVAMNMPKCRADDCHPGTGDCDAAHQHIFDTIHPSKGSPLKFFLEPVAVCLNHFQREMVDGVRYTDFSMVGLSGGGWTTTVYSAIDPRITTSIPVAGSLPLHLRADGAVGDIEQFLPEFYSMAGYPDLYLMGGAGFAREQVQILNQNDDCCFGPRESKSPATYNSDVRNYERQVKQIIARLGYGSFRVEIDQVATAHMISRFASTNLILGALSQNRHDNLGRDHVYLFVRSDDGRVMFDQAGSGEAFASWREVPGGMRTDKGIGAGWQKDTLFIFAKAGDGRILFNQVAPQDIFVGWQVLANATTDTAPTAAGRSDGVFVFIKAKDGRIMFDHAAPGGAFAGWREVPGGVRTDTALGTGIQKDSLFVFAKSSDGKVLFNQAAPHGAFVGWQALAGVTTDSAPQAAGRADDLFVFIKAKDGRVLFNQAAPGGAFVGWQELPGGARVSSVLSASMQGTTLFVFAKAADGRILFNQAAPHGGFVGWGVLTSF